MIERNRVECAFPVDHRKARIYFLDGRVAHFADPQLAYLVWLSLPKGIRAEFRGAYDTRPVYSWDYADVP
jgi:hypothetical protein